MMNPCYECPKYREYGEYLDEVLITKTSVSVVSGTPVSAPVQTEPEKYYNKKKLKIKVVFSKIKAKPQPQSGKCLMVGCKRKAEVKGYCQSCTVVRKYHEKRGNPVPDSLTPAQIKRRDRKEIAEIGTGK
jgi:hypothetical protein